MISAELIGKEIEVETGQGVEWLCRIFLRCFTLVYGL